MAASASRAPPALLAAGLLAGCAPTQSCLLPTQHPALKVDLYFGRAIEGSAPVSDAEWAHFAATELTPRFPDGFTVVDANGQWLNPATHATAQEATKLVEILAPDHPGFAARVQAVIDAYRARFEQQSVGAVSGPGCAAF